MQHNADHNSAKYQIKAYDETYIQVNEDKHEQSLIIMPDVLVTPWTVNDITTLKTADLDLILQYQPELIIIGTGKHLIFPEPSELLPLQLQQIGIELMDTGAACRTYTVLTAEQRCVAAALLLPR